MTWRAAFLRQAKSDFLLFEHLRGDTAASCHRLHYLQMSAEKLAKGVMTASTDASPPAFTHASLVRMLQVIRFRPEIQKALRFSDRHAFKAFIDSLLGQAAKVERLAPALAGNSPNPEYPWMDTTTRKVIAPADYGFSEFDPKHPQLAKLLDLLRTLLRFAT